MKSLSKLFARLTGDHGTDRGTAVADRIAQALSAAGLDRSGPGADIRSTIDRALADAGLQPQSDAPPAPPAAAPQAAVARVSKRSEATRRPSSSGAGQFLHATYANEHGRRDYRLYIPAGHDPAGPPRALVLMLHGCTQTAEDFAVGTRMNALADRHGFLVAYPQQVGKANHAKCWNWFRPEDQRRDAGEPSILAGIAQRIAEEHHVDRRRIFVAGLSAGAAMAVILGRTYPDIVRAIGVHSGLPYASAHDVPSAFATMQGRVHLAARRPATSDAPVPMILFHGDADRTVASVNADTLAAEAMRPGLRVAHETGRVPGGQAYTRDLALDDAGIRRFERWTVQGAGHAWSGGDSAGSYTDPAGPDASAAMVDFFLQQD